MADPLAGHRQEINDRRDKSRLSWPATRPDDPLNRPLPCPVEVGEIFKLRTCSIEITHRQRTREEGKLVWVATFVRYWPQGPPQMLTRGAGEDGLGYTTSAANAIDADDELAEASEADLSEPAEALRVPYPISGEPPEPEVIPHHQVEHLPSSVAAQAAYEADQRERRTQLRTMSAPQRLAALRRQIADLGPDAEAWRAAKKARGQAKRAGRGVR